MFRQPCLSAGVLYNVPRMLKAVQARRAFARRGVLGTAFWLKEHNRNSKPRDARKECLDLRIEPPALILKRLPNLLLGFVMIYTNGERMVRRPVVGPGDFACENVFWPLQPLVANQRSSPQRWMPNASQRLSEGIGLYTARGFGGSFPPDPLDAHELIERHALLRIYWIWDQKLRRVLARDYLPRATRNIDPDYPGISSDRPQTVDMSGAAGGARRR